MKKQFGWAPELIRHSRSIAGQRGIAQGHPCSPQCRTPLLLAFAFTSKITGTTLPSYQHQEESPAERRRVANRRNGRDRGTPMARLGHKKSRLGCRQCKARHVKVCHDKTAWPLIRAEPQETREKLLNPKQCDELKPCSNCARHGVQCSLVTWDATSAPPNPPATHSSSAPKRERPAQNTPEQPVSAPFDIEDGADKQS
jgi:hypothetical protein